MGKKQCLKCKIVTEKYTIFNLDWSNGTYIFHKTPTKLNKIKLCFKCTDKLAEWLDRIPTTKTMKGNVKND